MMARPTALIWVFAPRVTPLLVKAAQGHEDFSWRHERQIYGANYEEQAIGDGPIGRELERIRKSYIDAATARGDLANAHEQMRWDVARAVTTAERQLEDEPLSLAPVQVTYGMFQQVAA